MRVHRLFFLFTVLSLTACGQFSVSIDPLQTSIPTNTLEIRANTSTAIASPTMQVNPTATVVISSPTLVIPTATQVQQAPATLTVSAPPASTTAAEQTVKIV